ncbi:MAG: 2-phosphosulfolactate phosphatase family protein [Pseudanabaenaceae cyanobacterium]
MKISVYHTPAQVPAHVPIPECAIAVDVLRATTSIATALAAGASAIEVFADLEALEQASAKYPPEMVLKAAERGGSKVSGYDLGNSPFEYSAEVVKGKRIFMSTTNGTKALYRVQAVPYVVACALVNLGSVVEFLVDSHPASVWIVCSGWEGNFALEDTVCAGAVIAHLEAKLALTWGNDEAIAAVALYRQWHNKLEELLHHASHGQRLIRLGAVADLSYCATVNSLQVLPQQKQPGVLTAD